MKLGLSQPEQWADWIGVKFPDYFLNAIGLPQDNFKHSAKAYYGFYAALSSNYTITQKYWDASVFLFMIRAAITFLQIKMIPQGMEKLKSLSKDENYRAQVAEAEDPFIFLLHHIQEEAMLLSNPHSKQIAIVEVEQTDSTPPTLEYETNNTTPEGQLTFLEQLLINISVYPKKKDAEAIGDFVKNLKRTSSIFSTMSHYFWRQSDDSINIQQLLEKLKFALEDNLLSHAEECRNIVMDRIHTNLERFLRTKTIKYPMTAQTLLEQATYLIRYISRIKELSLLAELYELDKEITDCQPNLTRLQERCDEELKAIIHTLQNDPKIVYQQLDKLIPNFDRLSSSLESIAKYYDLDNNDYPSFDSIIDENEGIPYLRSFFGKCLKESHTPDIGETPLEKALLTLGLDPSDPLPNLRTLKTAYHKAALEAHPDKKFGDHEAFLAVNNAYTYLYNFLQKKTENMTSVPPEQPEQPTGASSSTPSK